MKIRIPNEKLWELEVSGQSVDQWIVENLDYGEWKEWIGVTMLPYRSFEIFDEEKALLFLLRFV
jgi:hypothetical protein